MNQENDNVCLLIVDDEPFFRSTLKMILSKVSNYHLTECSSGEEAVEFVKTHSCDCILLDINMQSLDGLSTLEIIKKSDPEVEVVMLTGIGGTRNIVRAIKCGAFDFIDKPITDETVLINSINNAVELKRRNQTMKWIEYELKTREEKQFPEIIGNSSVIINVKNQIKQFAHNMSNVLILGESGVGKELVARSIHKERAGEQIKPFVTINCGAIPENLFESELFGHVQGSFTGAYTNKVGLCEMANGGSLFLDEVSELPLSSQTKLLRLIQEREFKRVGSTKTIRSNFKLISASNVDLEQAVKEGKFRADLFYRISVLPIIVPSLKDRREDIPLLIGHFLKHYSKRGKPKSLLKSTMDILCVYEWRGNVRELSNCIERAIQVCPEDTIELKYFNLPLENSLGGKSSITEGDEDITPFKVFEIQQKEKEKHLLIHALREARHNVSEAARILGLHRNTLVRKMGYYQLEETKTQLGNY